MGYNIRTLQIFEAVYRNGSIIKAAQELSITPSAISHQMRNLREQVGEDLIEKRGRTIMFTVRGKRLAQTLAAAFSDIEGSIRRTISDSNQPLRIAVCSSFGQGWFIRHMKGIENRLGSVQLKMHAEDPHLSDTIADVFFTTQPLKEGFWSAKLMDETLVAVASPCSPKLEQMAKWPTLITTDLNEFAFAQDWKKYTSELGARHEGRLSDATFIGASHYVFALEMALVGAGIALVPEFLAESALAQGRAILWHPHRSGSGRAYYMNVKAVRTGEPLLREFTNFVRQAAYKERAGRIK